MAVSEPQLSRLLRTPDGMPLLEDSVPVLAVKNCSSCGREVRFDMPFWYWALNDGDNKVMFIKMHTSCFTDWMMRVVDDFTACEELENAGV